MLSTSFWCLVDLYLSICLLYWSDLNRKADLFFAILFKSTFLFVLSYSFTISNYQISFRNLFIELMLLVLFDIFAIFGILWKVLCNQKDYFFKLFIKFITELGFELILKFSDMITLNTEVSITLRIAFVLLYHPYVSLNWPLELLVCVHAMVQFTAKVFLAWLVMRNS